MTNNTIPNVPRELLERVLDYDGAVAIRQNARHELRALLSAPSPAGVDGWDVAGDILEKLSDAQAIIDGLRGEVARADGRLHEVSVACATAEQQRDQLAGLLREVHDTYRAAIHWEDLRSTMKRIDTALAELPQ